MVDPAGVSPKIDQAQVAGFRAWLTLRVLPQNRLKHKLLASERGWLFGGSHEIDQNMLLAFERGWSCGGSHEIDQARVVAFRAWLTLRGGYNNTD